MFQAWLESLSLLLGAVTPAYPKMSLLVTHMVPLVEGAWLESVPAKIPDAEQRLRICREVPRFPRTDGRGVLASLGARLKRIKTCRNKFVGFHQPKAELDSGVARELEQGGLRNPKRPVGKGATWGPLCCASAVAALSPLLDLRNGNSPPMEGTFLFLLWASRFSMCGLKKSSLGEVLAAIASPQWQISLHSKSQSSEEEVRLRKVQPAIALELLVAFDADFGEPSPCLLSAAAGNVNGLIWNNARIPRCSLHQQFSLNQMGDGMWHCEDVRV